MRCDRRRRRGGLCGFDSRDGGGHLEIDRRGACGSDLTTLFFDDARYRHEVSTQLLGARGFAIGQRAGVAVSGGQVQQFALQRADALGRSGGPRLQLAPPVVTICDVGGQARDFLA